MIYLLFSPMDVNIPAVNGMLLLWKPTGPEQKYQHTLTWKPFTAKVKFIFIIYYYFFIFTLMENLNNLM